MAVPHTVRGVKGRPGHIALVHPDTGEELGVVYPAAGGYRALMPDGRGCCSVLLEETFPTLHAAKLAVLEAHEPEPE